MLNTTVKLSRISGLANPASKNHNIYSTILSPLLFSSQLVIGHMRQRSFFLHVPPKCLQRKVWCPPTAFFDGLVFDKILACSFIPPYDAVDDNDKYTNR